MDTHEISLAFRSRPVGQIDMSFGDWFCRAIHQYDPRLRGETNVDKCKGLILESRYHEIPDLRDKLTAFNIELCKEML